MDRSDFSFLVARLERQAAASPGSYAFRVALLAALGYLALFVIAALILACVWLSWHELVTGGAFSIKLAILALVRRSTWSVWSGRCGSTSASRTVCASRATKPPQLFETLDELRAKMGGVRLHAVYITNEFNASIMQVPRWGVFGNYRNHLGDRPASGGGAEH